MRNTFADGASGLNSGEVLCLIERPLKVKRRDRVIGAQMAVSFVSKATSVFPGEPLGRLMPALPRISKFNDNKFHSFVLSNDPPLVSCDATHSTDSLGQTVI